MARLRISSSVNLHSGSRENPIEYFAQGLAFMRAMGFDAADMPSFFFNAAGDEPEKAVERIHQAAQEAGIRVELCHLPFGLKPDATEEETERFNAAVHQAIDTARLLGVDGRQWVQAEPPSRRSLPGRVQGGMEKAFRGQ